MFPKILRGIIFGGILKSHHPSVRSSCVQAITLYCMNGFPYNLTEVFGISRQSVSQKNHALNTKVKVTNAV